MTRRKNGALYMFLKTIDFKVFFLSLALGLLFVYLSTPPPTVIYVYPTPDNVGQIEYIDQAKNCFKFQATEVSCPATGVKTIPVQSGRNLGAT